MKKGAHQYVRLFTSVEVFGSVYFPHRSANERQRTHKTFKLERNRIYLSIAFVVKSEKSRERTARKSERTIFREPIIHRWRRYYQKTANVSNKHGGN